MYEDNDILKRYPRHDSDFTWSDSSPHWNEHGGELVISWTHHVLIFIGIMVLAAAILWTCAHSATCPCYNCLSKLLQPQPRVVYIDDWARNRALMQERTQPLAPPATLLADTTEGHTPHFEDRPPDYYQVVKNDLPPYPFTSTTSNPEWTGRPQIDHRNVNI